MHSQRAMVGPVISDMCDMERGELSTASPPRSFPAGEAGRFAVAIGTGTGEGVLPTSAAMLSTGAAGLAVATASNRSGTSTATVCVLPSEQLVQLGNTLPLEVTRDKERDRTSPDGSSAALTPSNSQPSNGRSPPRERRRRTRLTRERAEAKRSGSMFGVAGHTVSSPKSRSMLGR